MLSDVVAEWITTWRKRRGWSQERLAEECARLGMPELTTSSLKNLESGRPVDGVRKRMVTVDEVAVIAYALDISPIALICPFPERAEVTLFPAASPVPTYSALKWFAGESAVLTDSPHEVNCQAYKATLLPLALLRSYEHLLDRRDEASKDLVRHAADAEKTTCDNAVFMKVREEMLVGRIEVLDGEIVTLRTQFQARGYPCPALPPALEYLADRDSTGETSVAAIGLDYPVAVDSRVVER